MIFSTKKLTKKLGIWFGLGFSVSFRKLNCTRMRQQIAEKFTLETSGFLFYFFFLIKIQRFLFFNLFIYFLLHWVFIAASRLSLAVASGIYSLVMAQISLQWLVLLKSTGSRHTGLKLQHAGTRAQAQQLPCMVSAAPHVESSQTRDLTHVLCMADRFLSTIPPGSPWGH